MLLTGDLVVLSLERRPDRLAAFRAGLPDDWPWPVPVVVPAIDGRALVLPPAWRDAGAGAYGCALTHLLVLALHGHGDHAGLLVLEDDAVFAPDFTERLRPFLAEVPDDWALIMLGGQHVRLPVAVSPGIVRCIDTQRTHGYLARGAAVAALVDVWAGATSHIDHLMPEVQRRVPTYAPDPFLIGQRAGRSDVTGRTEAQRYWPTSTTAR